jgi:hypothetical protein
MILCRCLLGIGHEGQAPGLEDLHHEADAGAGKAGDDEKIKVLDGVIFGFEAFDIGEFGGVLLRPGCDGLAEGGKFGGGFDFFFKQDLVALHLADGGFIQLAERETRGPHTCLTPSLKGWRVGAGDG